MEIIKTTKTVEEIVGYKAFDGMEFDSKEECEKYENTASAVIKKRFMETCVKHVIEDIEITDEGENYFESGIGEGYASAIVRIENEEELKIALMYQELVLEDLHIKSRRFSSDDFGKDLLCYIGDCSYNEGDGSLDVGYENCYIWGTIDECVQQYRYCLLKIFDHDKNGKKNK